MAGRTIAIGDVHGCSAALQMLLDAIEPGSQDTLITLGDHIDRGPDSRGVLNLLIELASCCDLIPLLGNHEEMLLACLADHTVLRTWLSCGGTKTLLSYGWAPSGTRRRLTDFIPQEHWLFFPDCRNYHETGSHVFLHAGYVPNCRWKTSPARRYAGGSRTPEPPSHTARAKKPSSATRPSGRVKSLTWVSWPALIPIATAAAG